jgi:pyruvate/2-oxoglutarate dehydrogenase complex dihydrolipoamide dehydrogenase (E3) component
VSSSRAEFDLIVIGMGVGGEELAGRVAQAGGSVLGIEQRLVGGECPYWGCIPSKMMVRASNALAETNRVNRLAGAASARPDWAPVARRVRDATAGWDDTVAVERFEGKGGTFLRGQARFVARDAVEVDGERFMARRGVVVATGGEPAIPSIPGVENVPLWTNRDAIRAEELPSSLVVLGAGPIGLELAQAFHRFGTAITLIEMGEHALPAEEPEQGEAIDAVIREEGMTLHTGTSAELVEALSGGGVAVRLRDGSRIEGDRLLVATGRRLNIETLALDAAGIASDGWSIETDENLRAADGVWAIGDVTGKGAFTHTAMYQARIAAADLLGQAHAPADYSAVPRVTFTDPEVAGVGLTEAQARGAGLPVRTGTVTTASSARGWIHGPGAEHGVVKVVADADRETLVGASMMGPAAGDVIGFLALAIRERIPVARLRQLVYPYPTFVRAVEDALRELGLG